jgi:hypothetical protein
MSISNRRKIRFFNISNEQTGNVIESIPNFELELYLKEIASADIIKDGMNQNILIQINYT